MNIFALESSCDETAAAVVKDGRKVLSSVVYTQIAEHQKYGGVVPEIASRRHAEHITRVAEQALAEAGLTLSQMDAVAVTAAPGLIGALLVGVNFAKGLAFAAGKPLIAVHHIRGHIAANYLAFPALKPPFLALVVSGGHTQILLAESYTRFHTIGRTRDDAAGEAYDKAARVLGFPYPGGLYMDEAAHRGDPSRYTLPRPEVDGFPYDFSFSGLKTAVVNTVHNLTQKGEPFCPDDMAASFQAAAVEMLSKRFMAAAEEFGCKKCVLAGGVAANSGLRQRLTEMTAERGFELFLPPLSLCGDNAAMIGSQAFYEFQDGCEAGPELNAYAGMEIERAF